jgi:hypothetical protein
MASPLLAVSVQPSSFAATLYPGENVTFNFTVTDAELIFTNAAPDTSCILSGGQLAKIITQQSVQESATIFVAGNASPGVYTCVIEARQTVLDPPPAFQSSGGSMGGGRSPTVIEEGLWNGSLVVVPSRITLKPDENGSIVVERQNILNWSAYSEPESIGIGTGRSEDLGSQGGGGAAYVPGASVLTLAEEAERSRLALVYALGAVIFGLGATAAYLKYRGVTKARHLRKGGVTNA